MTGDGPYRRAAALYVAAGWPGVVPLPAGAKGPPPSGWTGRGAPYPSTADVQAWCDGPEGAGNIALRVSDGVLGLDVDAYDGKPGAETLAELEARLGALPAGPVSTARAVSGIRMYRAPVGLRWPGKAGPGIDIIQAAHRYAVVWPSWNPDAAAQYVWREGDGERFAPPRLDGLPELPAAWVEYLTGLAGTGSLDTAEMGDARVREWVRALREGQPCERVREALDRARVTLGAPGADRHHTMTEAQRAIAAYGGEGHAGAAGALAQLRAAFEAALAGEREPGPEWDRALGGAVRLAAAAHPEPRQECDCAVWAGAGLDFTSQGAEAVQVGKEPGAPGAPAEVTEGAPAAAGATLAPGGLAEALERRLMSAAQVREIRPPAPLVDGLLTLDSESWLIARSGAGKTFVALDLAGHVAAGHSWHGREVAAGAVLYLAAEGAAGMGTRVRAWEQRNGEMSDVTFLPMPVQAAREEHWAALVEVCRRRQPVLIVLDTQARITVGLAENDNSDMGRFVEAIGRLRQASRACVLVVHHLGRSGQDARGASAIDAAQDTELRLTRTAERRVVLETDKQRHLADGARVELELHPVALDDGGTSLVVGPPLNGAPEQPDWRTHMSLNQGVIVDLMAELFPQRGATKAEAKAEARKRARTEPGTGKALEPMSESSFRRAWDHLTAAGGRLIREHGSQRYVLADADEGVSE